MNIKNIQVFESEPIVVKISKDETITINKVSALTTLKLYQCQDIISGLFQLGSCKSDVEATELLVNLFTANYEKIVDVLATATNKPKDYIELKLGYNEMVMLLLALFEAINLEGQELVKKNQTEMM